MRLKLLLLVVPLSWSEPSPGREIKHQAILKLGQEEVAIKGRIPTRSDSVSYKFVAHTGQLVSIVVKTSGKLVAEALLVSPSGLQEGPGAELTNRLLESGTYRVRVTPREQTSGAFVLYINLL